MSWVIFSLLAAIGFGSISVLYKIVFEKLKGDMYFALFISAIVNLVAGLAIFYWQGFTLLNNLALLVVLIGGLSVAIAILFFYKATKIGDATVVGPLFNLNGLFIAVMAAIFLGEVFTFDKYLGVALLVLGAVLLSKEKGSGFKLSKAFGLMVIATLAYSLSSILTKYLLGFAGYWIVFGYFRIALFAMVLPILAWNHKSIKKARKGKALIGVITLAEITGLGAGLLFTIALSLGPATLVSSLILMNPLFTLVAVILFSKFLPTILKEDISWSVLWKKIFSIGLMVAGAILVI